MPGFIVGKVLPKEGQHGRLGGIRISINQIQLRQPLDGWGRGWIMGEGRLKLPPGCAEIASQICDQTQTVVGLAGNGILPDDIEANLFSRLQVALFYQFGSFIQHCFV